MFNMKKLIDETDFDNLNELTSHWNASDHPQKENKSILSNEQQSQKPKKNSKVSYHKQDQSESKNAKKRNVVPQVMDQDTEHFKNKLEHLLNNFKTDAVSEFMNMKKDMLEYQKDCVKNDTHKYLTMYEEKHQQLLQTKEKLLAMSKEAEKKTIQVQLLSEHIGKLNERLRITKYLSRPFSILYQNKEHQKMMKFKEKQAKIFDEKRLKRKSIWGWMNLYKDHKAQTDKVNTEQRIEKEVNDIVGRFQKEMQLLKEKLAEANRKNQEYENNKHAIHENLKKAFLRGMCAMNMQAMGVLGSQNAEQIDSMTQKDYAKTQNDRSYFANNMSYVDNRGSNREEVLQNQSMFVSKAQTATKMNSTMNNMTKSNNGMIVNSSKAESKNHKWKQAPIMGVEQKVENQQPRMQIVRPTTQGKVIKVVDGRSAVQNGVHRAADTNKKPAVSDRFSVAGSSRKKV